MAQAFKTAGRLFEVIKNNTASVIVPYNDEAERLIEALDSDTCDMSIFRRAQKYMVGIYAGTNRKLTENRALRVLRSGALALRKEYYDKNMGLITEGALQETLIF